MNRILWKCMIAVVQAAILTSPLVAAEPEQQVRLIIRGDDMGFSHAANAACLRCYEHGVMTSTEVMVPCPWFAEAVELLKQHADLDVGIHLTLTSEWSSLRRRPLTNAPNLAAGAHGTGQGARAHPQAGQLSGGFARP